MRTEKLDPIGARLEHTPRNSLKRLAQEMECQSLVPEWQHNFCSHPMKVGAWCAVSARRVVVRVFFNETINCEKYLRVHRTPFPTPSVICEL
jgi:hypothetical protein